MNVAKNNLNFLYDNTNNTLTSSTISIKKKYRLRFLSNDVRFLMLIFNTLIITIVFFEKFIVDFSLFIKKISTTSNHFFIFELFEQDISNFIVSFNSKFFFRSYLTKHAKQIVIDVYVQHNINNFKFHNWIF